jgi:hypothetical protein
MLKVQFAAPSMIWMFFSDSSGPSAAKCQT